MNLSHPVLVRLTENARRDVIAFMERAREE
jgi:hypothetical protein